MHVGRVLTQTDGDQLEAKEGRNRSGRAKVQGERTRKSQGTEREGSRIGQGAI